MGAEVIDTNVLVLGSAEENGWGRPRVPTDDIVVHRRVRQWLMAFREDSNRLLVMDIPAKTILTEYKNNMVPADYGRRVVQHKFDMGALHPVELNYQTNGSELVALLPPEVEALVHDLGDRKMIAAAYHANAPIYNATDGDWTEEKVVQGLELLSVTVVQLLNADELMACRERERDQ